MLILTVREILHYMKVKRHRTLAPGITEAAIERLWARETCAFINGNVMVVRGG